MMVSGLDRRATRGRELGVCHGPAARRAEQPAQRRHALVEQLGMDALLPGAALALDAIFEK